MFNQLKPGHVLRFGTCPSSITSPSWHGSPNQTEHAWPTGISSLGNVICMSHPSGALGDICTQVATRQRTTGNAFTRGISYSKVGSFVREKQGRQDVQIGSTIAGFVGYTDGFTNYLQCGGDVFSKDFSGCLMVEYTLGGARYVAHAAANATPSMDCKQAFLNYLQAQGATLDGWFRPYDDAIDGAGKAASFGLVTSFIGGNVNLLTTFGVISNGHGYAIEAFKPSSIKLTDNDWVVTRVTPKTMSQSWTV